MAVATSAILAGVAAAVGIAGTVMSSQNKPKQTPVPTYNAKKEEQKAATQEAEANKKRILAETDTIKTSALGNTGTTETKKKTLLGG